MKFQPKVSYSSTPNDWGEVFANGSSTGVINRLLTKKCDFIIGYFIDMKRSKAMKSSDAYSFLPIVVIVPPGAHYTSLENLIRPFTLNVWLSVIVTITLACLFMTSVKLCSVSLQKWIFEHDSANSHYNLLMIIVGGSINILPKRDIPRLLIMSFVMFCLVVRTVYQSQMFNFLQAGGSKKMVKTLDEMAERKFKLYYLDISDDDWVGGIIHYPNR